MGVKDPDRHQFVASADHFQDMLGIFGVSDPHRVENTPLDGVEKHLGAFPRRFDELVLLLLEIKEGKGADAENQERDGDNNYPCCKALEFQRNSIASAVDVIPGGFMPRNGL